jgi:hypothetical protein
LLDAVLQSSADER